MSKSTLIKTDSAGDSLVKLDAAIKELITQANNCRTLAHQYGEKRYLQGHASAIRQMEKYVTQSTNKSQQELKLIWSAADKVQCTASVSAVTPVQHTKIGNTAYAPRDYSQRAQSAAPSLPVDKRSRFKWADFPFPEGTVFHWRTDPNITFTVTGTHSVKLYGKGSPMSLQAATRKIGRIMIKKTIHGHSEIFWVHNGKTLRQIFKETYPQPKKIIKPAANKKPS